MLGSLDTGQLAVIMVFAIPLAAIIGGLAIEALKIVKGSPKGADSPAGTEETRMIQAIYNQLSRMEQRIEALETILLDRDRKDG